jgi:ABC-type ATPase involved in cell division
MGKFVEFNWDKNDYILSEEEMNSLGTTIVLSDHDKNQVRKTIMSKMVHVQEMVV